jgi:hypothetical protein
MGRFAQGCHADMDDSPSCTLPRQEEGYSWVLLSQGGEEGVVSRIRKFQNRRARVCLTRKAEGLSFHPIADSPILDR